MELKKKKKSSLSSSKIKEGVTFCSWIVFF